MEYSDLVYNIFYLYNRDFYNCISYGHLRNNKYFKTKFPTQYNHMVDRTPTSKQDMITTKLVDTIGYLQSIDTTSKNQIIQPYTEFFTSTKDKFLKDDILFAFNTLLTTICGDDGDSGLRNVEDVLDISRLESNLTGIGIIFPSLFSDMKNENLKNLITDENKVFFEVNNKNTEIGKYLYNNSIDYTTTPNFITDYSNNPYDKTKPNEFNYLANKTNGTGYDRGYRLPTKKSKEHQKGYAVDTNISLTGNKLSDSNYSQVIKKLMVLTYLYTDNTNDMLPYRFEISSYYKGVPHIHLDKTTSSSLQPSSGISLFKANYMEFMNGGSSDTDDVDKNKGYWTELEGKTKAIILDMIEKTYKIASDFSIIFTYDDNSKSKKYWGKERVVTGNGIMTAGEISKDNTIDGNVVSSSDVTYVNDNMRKIYYNSVLDDLNEYKQLNKVVFSDTSKGYDIKERDTHNETFDNLKRSVEYLSYVINTCVVEYFANKFVQSIDVSDIYNVVVGKVKVEGNFIVIEK